jgi:hypothetical protein
MDLKTYKKKFKEGESAPGWDAIDDAFGKIYGGDEPLGHMASDLPVSIGGTGPDGISIFRAKGHLHYVTYGFSTIYYDEEAVGGEFSGYGFELTFRLKSDAIKQEDLPLWPCVVLQNLFRYVTESGRWFEAGHCVPTTNRPLFTDYTFEDSVITGLAFSEDPELGTIDTPHGKVQFLQMVGITKSEAEAHIAEGGLADDLIARLAEADPLLVTDMKRGL